MGLDEAWAVLREWFNDAGLKARARGALGDRFIPYFGEKPLAITFRHLTTCNSENGYWNFRRYNVI
jgi:hypothetical protein